MTGTGSTATRPARRWLLLWLAWMALSAAALEVVHIEWPHSRSAPSVLILVAGIGSTLIFDLRRRAK